MNHPGTAREALIAEVIGDVARLLDRAEALQPAMIESRQAFVEAQTQLADQLADFETRVSAITEKAKVLAVKHILVRTDEAARRSVDVQTRAMAEAAQTLFKAELDPALQRLAMPLQRLALKVDHPWEQWLTHAATAAVASTATWALAAYLWAR
jgi:hypothetical protein